MARISRRSRRTVRRAILSIAAALCTFAGAIHPAPAGAGTFDVHLEDFTDNPATEDIAYVRMYVELQGPVIVVSSCRIGGAAPGWWAGTPMCFMDGPCVVLEAYDHWGGNSLQDGRLFTITSNTTAVGIDRIYFWHEGEVGPGFPNLFPDPVRLAAFSGESATFSAGPTPVDPGGWGSVKARYR